MSALAKTILVTTDFSEASEQALDTAALLARRDAARLVLAYVAVEEAEPMITDPSPEAVAVRARTQLRALAERRLAGLDPELAVVTASSAAQGICDHARAIGADLVVLSTHGRTGLAHALIGSVAERVVRLAPCPVLTVRAKRE